VDQILTTLQVHIRRFMSAGFILRGSNRTRDGDEANLMIGPC